MGAGPASSPLLGGAVNRPLARVEDLAREPVRSLPPELAARAVLLPEAPPDLVTANRSTVSEGDRVVPLAGIWRDERLRDPVEREKLQAMSDRIDEAAAFDEDDHRAVEYTLAPKGVPGAELDAGQREVLRLLRGEPRPFGVAGPRGRLRPRRTGPSSRRTPALSRKDTQ